MFDLGSTTVYSRLIDGSFPNYEQVIPKTNPRQFTIGRDELIAGIRRVAVLADSSTHQIKMSVRPERLPIERALLDEWSHGRNPRLESLMPQIAAQTTDSRA